MSASRFAVFLLASFLFAPAALAQGESPVHGLWVTPEGKSRVEIYSCGENLCGRIVWLREPLREDGSVKRDRENPDEALRSREIVGLQIMQGFERANDSGTEWEDGEIYNPEDGKTYSANIRLRDDGTLRLRGYVGIPLLGKTQIWERYEGESEENGE